MILMTSRGGLFKKVKKLHAYSKLHKKMCIAQGEWLIIGSTAKSWLLDLFVGSWGSCTWAFGTYNVLVLVPGSHMCYKQSPVQMNYKIRLYLSIHTSKVKHTYVYGCTTLDAAYQR